jgi:hypothetical protein
MTHTDRISKRDSRLAFLKGAAIAIGATAAATALFIDFASKRGIP